MENAERGWLSYLAPINRANRLLRENPQLWEDMKIEETDWGSPIINVGDDQIYCWDEYWD
jgi:hypothetical protein